MPRGARLTHETFRLLRVDADKRPDLLKRFHVTEIPTLIVIAEECVRGRLSRPRGCAEIYELLSPWLK